MLYFLRFEQWGRLRNRKEGKRKEKSGVLLVLTAAFAGPMRIHALEK